MNKIMMTLILAMGLITVVSAQTEIKIPSDSIPKQVMEQLHRKFHDYSISARAKK